MTGYDRARLRPGIVHIGLGNFHRAHMAVYLDELFARGEPLDWAIIGAGVRPADAAMRAALKAQDCLSTVIELDPRGHRARRVGAMVDFLPVDPSNGPLIAAMTRPEIRIVSLTVTEGGYFLDAAGQFDPSAPEIQADARDPAYPTTAFGAIVAALKARKAARMRPFTVLSCDNLPGNGRVARGTVVGLARLSDPALADWIEAHVAFPNCMVDRITPATGDRERALPEAAGDPVPVTCEPFRQWVLEDNFPAGRPALEKVGVTFSSQVHAFETMKIRILNGGHALIAYAGALLDHALVHQAMADPLVQGFLAKVERDEILPIVPPVPGADLTAYLAQVVARFSNPEIADTTRRLCFDGSNRQPKFILPSLRDGLARGALPEGLILASALWRRYCRGETDSKAPIAPNDPQWDRLHSVARSGDWLGMADIYGDLGQDARVRSRFDAWAQALEAKGTRAVLQDWLAGA